MGQFDFFIINTRKVKEIKQNTKTKLPHRFSHCLIAMISQEGKLNFNTKGKWNMGGVVGPRF